MDIPSINRGEFYNEKNNWISVIKTNISFKF